VKVGIRENGFRQDARDFSQADLFDAAARIGYQGIELATMPERDERGRTRRGVWPEELRPGEAASIRQAAAARGLEIPTVCPNWIRSYGEYHPRLDDWKRATELIKLDVDFAAEVGARVLLVTLAFARATWFQACALLDEWATYGGTKGVTVAFEGSCFHRIGLGGQERLIQLVDEVRNPHLGVYAHPEGTGRRNAEEIRSIGHRIVGLHSREIRGDVDYPEMLRALREVGYDGFWIFEVSGDLIESSRAAWERVAGAAARAG
jgi:sugar phosphate isomerase/epimerase